MTHSKTFQLNSTLYHHTDHVHAIAFNSEGDRLLSGGDDGKVVVWNLSTAEKLQVISCAFNGPVGALVWIPSMPGISAGFAFGCADGSIHFYERGQSGAAYVYLTQVSAHDGPVLDLKFDSRFSRIASVGQGFPQVWSRELATFNRMNRTPTPSRFTAISVHFCDEGASLLDIINQTCSECYSIEPWTLKWSKQLRTRIGHSCLKNDHLAVTNLHDGIDIYHFPTLQLVRTLSHNNFVDRLFQTSFSDNNWLISGGQDGFARMYYLASGQMVQQLDHCEDGEAVRTVASHTVLHNTTIVTATSDIKIWKMTEEDRAEDIPASVTTQIKPPTAGGLSVPQLLLVLIIAFFGNYAVTHFDSIAMHLTSWFKAIWIYVHSIFIRTKFPSTDDGYGGVIYSE